MKRTTKANMKMAVNGFYEPPSKQGSNFGVAGEEERMQHNFTPLHQGTFVNNMPLLGCGDQSMFTPMYSNNNGFGHFASPDGSVVGLHLRHPSAVKSDGTGYSLVVRKTIYMAELIASRASKSVLLSNFLKIINCL